MSFFPLKMRVAVAALATLVAACTDDAVPPAIYPALTATEELRLHNAVDAGARTYFSGAAMDRDGAIYLVEWSLRMVLVYDSTGKYVRGIGSGGDLPGQFSLPGSIGIIGDTVWIADPRLRRLTLFTRAGELLSIVEDTLSAGEANAAIAGLLPDGSKLYTLMPSTLPTGIQPDREIPLVKVSPQGQRDTLFKVPVAGTYGLRVGSSVGYVAQPYDERPIIAVKRDGSAWLTIERQGSKAAKANATLTLHTATGANQWSMSVALTPVSIPRHVRDSIVDASALHPAQRDSVSDWLHIPDVMPLVSAASLSDDGSIWLQESTRTDVARWIRLDSAGVPNGQLNLPASARVLHSSNSRLWVVQHDTANVPTVLRYRIK